MAVCGALENAHETFVYMIVKRKQEQLMIMIRKPQSNQDSIQTLLISDRAGL